jgi:hypothetical protein
LIAAGYQVYAVNPASTAKYRTRHSTSGAKSDPGDAKVLADLARTDRHNHRPVAGDSDLVEAIKTLARAHQGWCGPASGRPTSCAPPCGSSTRLRSKRSQTWHQATRWPC